MVMPGHMKANQSGCDCSGHTSRRTTMLQMCLKNVPCTTVIIPRAPAVTLSFLSTCVFKHYLIQSPRTGSICTPAEQGVLGKSCDVQQDAEQINYLFGNSDLKAVIYGTHCRWLRLPWDYESWNNVRSQLHQRKVCAGGGMFQIHHTW